MTASKVQLTGGKFQDAEGNVLSLGYLKMLLSQDAAITGIGNICSGIEIMIPLDVNGSVVASPAQSVWGNDVMSPVNTYYKVTGYSAVGQPCWGPNCQQVTGSGTFDVGTWVPGQVISWVPSVQVPQLEVGGVPTTDQQLLNFIAGAGITIVDAGADAVSITAPAQGGFPSGANVVQLPILTGSSAGLNGYTVVMRIPARIGN